jgi:ABC-2 type transport system ATP-binding protein
MNEGRIVAQGPVEALRREHGTTEYHVYTDVELEGSARENGSFRLTVESMDGVEAVRERLSDRGGEVVDIRTEEASLEGVFLDLASREVDARSAGSDRVGDGNGDGGADDGERRGDRGPPDTRDREAGG